VYRFRDLFDIDDGLDASGEYFLDSVLALYLGDWADEVYRAGRLKAIAPGETFHAEGNLRLHVVLSGVLQSEDAWQGPGCHFNGDGRTYTARGDAALIWILERDGAAWQAPEQSRLRSALVSAIEDATCAERAAQLPSTLPDASMLCDSGHLEIIRLVDALRGVTQEETAEAIFQHVRAMPYRFGGWQEPASETLRQGWGMCTSKANLQVALMRAAGLDAGFVEVTIPMSVLGVLIPKAWLPLMRPDARHFFAAVKLGDRWHAADSSYNDASLEIYLAAMPSLHEQLKDLRPAILAEGKPYNLAAAVAGTDPFDIIVEADLSDDMAKPTRFAAHHFEALNTRLDLVQGARHRGAMSRVG